jgi:photosystem II PsbM protein
MSGSGKCYSSVGVNEKYFIGINLMQTNDLGFVASLLFIFVPTIFLIILYIQTNTRNTGAGE